MAYFIPRFTSKFTRSPAKMTPKRLAVTADQNGMPRIEATKAPVQAPVQASSDHKAFSKTRRARSVWGEREGADKRLPAASSDHKAFSKTRGTRSVWGWEGGGIGRHLIGEAYIYLERQQATLRRFLSEIEGGREGMPQRRSRMQRVVGDVPIYTHQSCCKVHAYHVIVVHSSDLLNTYFHRE